MTDTPSDPPGVPLASGFNYRPSREVPEAELDDKAKARVLEKWAEFDRSQRLTRKAMLEDRTVY